MLASSSSPRSPAPVVIDVDKEDDDADDVKFIMVVKPSASPADATARRAAAPLSTVGRGRNGAGRTAATSLSTTTTTTTNSRKPKHADVKGWFSTTGRSPAGSSAVGAASRDSGNTDISHHSSSSNNNNNRKKATVPSSQRTTAPPSSRQLPGTASASTSWFVTTKSQKRKHNNDNNHSTVGKKYPGQDMQYARKKPPQQPSSAHASGGGASRRGSHPNTPAMLRASASSSPSALPFASFCSVTTAATAKKTNGVDTTSSGERATKNPAVQHRDNNTAANGVIDMTDDTDDEATILLQPLPSTAFATTENSKMRSSDRLPATTSQTTAATLSTSPAASNASASLPQVAGKGNKKKRDSHADKKISSSTAGQRDHPQPSVEGYAWRSWKSSSSSPKAATSLSSSLSVAAAVATTTARSLTGNSGATGKREPAPPPATPTANPTGNTAPKTASPSHSSCVANCDKRGNRPPSNGNIDLPGNTAPDAHLLPTKKAAPSHACADRTTVQTTSTTSSKMPAALQRKTETHQQSGTLSTTPLPDANTAPGDVAQDDNDDDDIEAYDGPRKLMPTTKFKELWEKWEKLTIVDIERGSMIRGANSHISTSDTTDQESAQYGRLLVDGMDKILRAHLDIEPTNDAFIDLGHGIGNNVLQASYTLGCESRGIEVVGDRHLIANNFVKEEFEKERELDYVVNYIATAVGEITLRHGRLEDPVHRGFLTGYDTRLPDGQPQRPKIVKAVLNNYNGVFADKSMGVKHTYTLDDYAAGLFADMLPGSVLVTLHPLNLGPASIRVANQKRHARKLCPSSVASFYEMEQIALGPKNKMVSWSEGSEAREDLYIYKYTRVGRKNATFLCTNPDCELAEHNKPIPAVKKVLVGDQNRFVINNCECNFTEKTLRDRGAVQYME